MFSTSDTQRQAMLSAGPILAIRTMLHMLIVAILTCVFFWPSALSAALGLRESLGTWTIRTYGRVSLWALGVKATLSGTENVPSEGGFVLIANHESHFDGVCLIAELPRTLCIVGKKELFWIPVLGWAFNALGFISLDRGNRRKARRGMSKVEQELRAGQGVLLFPEGKRSSTEELLPFKRGAFVTAIQAGVPILPVGIAGSRAVLAPGERVITSGRIHLTVGEPIVTEGLTHRDRVKLTERSQQIIEALRLEAARHLHDEEDSQG